MTRPTRPIQIGYHTDPGPRETNQDTVLSIELPDGRWLVAVADGMGGLEEGQLASQTALGALYRKLGEGATLQEAVHAANLAVYEKAKGRAMGTTVVAALLSGTIVEVAHVGDSRAYHLDPLGLVCLTRDHTLGEEAARTGELEGKEVAGTRWGGTLARFLGAEKTVAVDLASPFALQKGGWLLLCSDGLHGVLSEEEIEAVLRGGREPTAAARRLVAEALNQGSQDNVSVALVHHEAESPAATEDVLKAKETLEDVLEPKEASEGFLPPEEAPEGSLPPEGEVNEPFGESALRTPGPSPTEAARPTPASQPEAAPPRTPSAITPAAPPSDQPPAPGGEGGAEARPSRPAAGKAPRPGSSSPGVGPPQGAPQIPEAKGPGESSPPPPRQPTPRRGPWRPEEILARSARHRHRRRHTVRILVFTGAILALLAALVLVLNWALSP